MSYDQGETVEMPPVTDWVNDWDWLDEQWGPNAIDIWNQIREQTPMASTERYGRAWMPVTLQAVSEIANDTVNFSSIFVNVSRPDSKRNPAPPITSDPPEHRDHRRLLLPAFSPKQINPMEKEMREYCQGLIANLDGRDKVDGSADYAQNIPVHAICQLLGIGEEDADMFRDWIYRNFQLAPRDNKLKEDLNTEMDAYFTDMLQTRVDNPTDDLTTLIAQAEIDGEPVDHRLKVGYMKLMIIAGIDTTWSAIGSGMWHFAQHPEEVERLLAVPNDDILWMQAMEEVLRFYAPVTMARKVIGDTEIQGCPVHVGDQTLVTFPAANHDPEAFDDPEKFDIDRTKNRHVAFGLGIHRCLGSNLARLELLIALQEWIRAFPNYRLDPDRETEWANGQVRGPRMMPLILGEKA